MVISYVRVRLPEFLGDLVKRKSFEEMQPQRLPLLLGKRTQYFPPAVPSEKSLNALVVFCPSVAGLVTFERLVRDSGQIESVRFQFPSAEKSLRVGHLDDPRTRRAFPAVKQPALSMDVKEHFLDKILCLSFVAKNSSTNISDGMRIAPKEHSESFTVTSANLGEKVPVGEFRWG